MTRFLAFLLCPVLLGASLGACSNDGSANGFEVETQATSTEDQLREKLEAAGTDSSSLADKPTDLVWDDLMPEGEMEKLEALYEDFYDELEDNIASGQQTLLEAGEEQDIASLIAEGSANDTMEQIGTYNVVEDLDGEHVRIPGYVVPFDFSADATHSEFLLVPYFGACLHTPPPPPNQIVFVKASPAATIDSIYDPVWIEGTLSTGEFTSGLGNSAYELQLSKIEPYEY